VSVVVNVSRSTRLLSVVADGLKKDICRQIARGFKRAADTSGRAGWIGPKRIDQPPVRTIRPGRASYDLVGLGAAMYGKTYTRGAVRSGSWVVMLAFESNCSRRT